MYIVKAKIKNFSIYGNQKLLRRGSPHFLPNTEVVLCHFYNSQYKIHHKLWVRGIHKSGLLKTRPVYFKFLTELKLEEVLNLTAKTLNFIEKNNILTTGEENSAYNLEEIKNLIQFFQSIQEPEILPVKIEDSRLLKYQIYLQKLQNLLKNEFFDEVIENYLKFPIKIKKRIDFTPQLIDKKDFLLNYKTFFFDKVSKSIIETDLETIFPSKKRIIIGLTEIDINESDKFLISKVEIY